MFQRLLKSTAIQQNASVARLVRSASSMAPVGRVLSESTEMYQRGQCFIHKEGGFRGVILRSDRSCQLENLFAESTEGAKEEPFYLVVPDNRDLDMGPLYVSHSEISPFFSYTELVHEALLFFQDLQFREGAFESIRPRFIAQAKTA
eukprot:Colp12_sorted_trinity150504_noHs@8712